MLRLRVVSLLVSLAVAMACGCSTPVKKAAPSTVARNTRSRVAPKVDGPFKDYDSKVVTRIQDRWNDLLDASNYAGYKTGTVVVRFSLHADGTVSDIGVVTNNATASLSVMCLKAVSDPAPYEPWPENMRRAVGADFRSLTFSFYYN